MFTQYRIGFFFLFKSCFRNSVKRSTCVVELRCIAKLLHVKTVHTMPVRSEIHIDPVVLASNLGPRNIYHGQGPEENKIQD